jgi:hypothetical protein
MIPESGEPSINGQLIDDDENEEEDVVTNRVQDSDGETGKSKRRQRDINTFGVIDSNAIIISSTNNLIASIDK